MNQQLSTHDSYELKVSLDRFVEGKSEWIVLPPGVDIAYVDDSPYVSNEIRELQKGYVESAKEIQAHLAAQVEIIEEE